MYGHAILPGNPLCDSSQHTKVARAFLNWLNKNEDTKRLKPIWVLVGHGFEVLGERFGWKTFTCAAENRVDASKNDAGKEHDVALKIRHAEKQGIKIRELEEGQDIPDDLRSATDVRIEEWKKGRDGKKHVHIMEITPWRDPAHRRYFFAQDKEGKVHAMVVLAQLAVRGGHQVKLTLDFPGAQYGTIEHMILYAIHAAKDSGTTSLTFAGAATNEFYAVHNMGGVRVRMLEHTFQAIAKGFKLTQKSGFRQKLGGEEDPIYVCYSPHGLGVTGVRAVVGLFESDH